MGLSHIKGNSGFIGVDKRGETGSNGTTGSVSVKKHFLERKRGNFAPIESNASLTGILYQEDWEDFVGGDWFQVPDGVMQWSVVSTVGVTGGTGGVVFDTNLSSWTYLSGTDVHLWVDIYIHPKITNITLDFDWQCNGESLYDYGYVWITNTGDTVTNTPRESAADLAKRLGGDTSIASTNVYYRRYNATYTAGAASNWVSEPRIYLVSGATQDGGGTVGDPGSFVPGVYNRFYFSFTADGSIENDPPLGVDNIVWRYTASEPIVVNPNSPDE